MINFQCRYFEISLCRPASLHQNFSLFPRRKGGKEKILYYWPYIIGLHSDLVDYMRMYSLVTLRRERKKNERGYNNLWDSNHCTHVGSHSWPPGIFYSGTQPPDNEHYRCKVLSNSLGYLLSYVNVHTHTSLVFFFL